VVICAPYLRVGRVNFTTVEDILPSEEVLDSTFFLLEHPIIILLNLGASHEFISLACGQKAMLTLWAMNALYSISTPGGRMVVDHMVRPIPLELAERLFLTSLIVLEGQGIDVILGMNWMMRHKGVLDISAHLVHLHSPVFDKISLQLPLVARLQASIHTVIASVSSGWAKFHS
jgi:hypothetical protein